MQQVLEQLIQAGANINESLPRFMGNEELYIKFLGKFLDDQSYQNLKEALDAGDADQTFKTAHTLKGVAANLGLTPIFESAGEIVEQYRNGDPDEGCVRESWQKLSQLYNNICGIIREYAE